MTEAESRPRHEFDLVDEFQRNEVRQVGAVPRTLSGKVVEVPTKRILMGADPTKVVSRDSLANPEALDYFVELADYDS